MRRSPSSCSSTSPLAPRSGSSSFSSDTDSFTLPVTQEDLRRWWGRPRACNKAISLFVRLEWLELEGRNHYRILDRQALEDRARL